MQGTSYSFSVVYDFLLWLIFRYLICLFSLFISLMFLLIKDDVAYLPLVADFRFFLPCSTVYFLLMSVYYGFFLSFISLKWVIYYFTGLYFFVLWFLHSTLSYAVSAVAGFSVINYLSFSSLYVWQFQLFTDVAGKIYFIFYCCFLFHKLFCPSLISILPCSGFCYRKFVLFFLVFMLSILWLLLNFSILSIQ